MSIIDRDQSLGAEKGHSKRAPPCEGGGQTAGKDREKRMRRNPSLLVSDRRQGFAGSQCCAGNTCPPETDLLTPSTLPVIADFPVRDEPEAANPYQRILKKAFDKRIPLTAHWELTRRCNLSCIHCYVSQPSGDHDELATSEVRGILGQLADAGCLFLAFTGGEIFCRSDLFEILDAAVTGRFAVRVFTNGTLLTPEAAERLAGLALAGVEISLYATDPAVHDRITTVPGSHARTVAGIERCCRCGIPVTIKSPLFRHNVGEFAALKRYAAEVGALFKFDLLLTPGDDGAPLMREYGLSEDELYEFIRVNGSPPETTPTAPEPTEALCGAGANTVGINPYGDVYPCLAIRQSIGSLREHSLVELWNSASPDGILSKLREARYIDMSACCCCDIAAHCVRCPGVALAESGDFLQKSDSACILARATKRAFDSLSGGTGS